MNAPYFFRTRYPTRPSNTSRINWEWSRGIDTTYESNFINGSANFKIKPVDHAAAAT